MFLLPPLTKFDAWRFSYVPIFNINMSICGEKMHLKHDIFICNNMCMIVFLIADSVFEVK